MSLHGSDDHGHLNHVPDLNDVDINFVGALTPPAHETLLGHMPPVPLSPSPHTHTRSATYYHYFGIVNDEAIELMLLARS